MPRRKPATPPPSVTRLSLAVSARRGTLTQAQAAKEIGINQRTLSTVERGGPVSLDTARALARWLGGEWTTDAVADAAKAAAGGGS